MMKKALFLLLISVAPVFAQQQPATVILVRHAEKMAEPANDPPLSEAGRVRAEALRNALASTGVDAVLSTPYKRTMETALAVAAPANLQITSTPIGAGGVAAYARDIVDRIRREGGGRTTLVVSHSNTLGPVIRALGGPDIGAIADERYDDLFVLIVQDGQPARLIQAKYGKHEGH